MIIQDIVLICKLRPRLLSQVGVRAAARSAYPKISSPSDKEYSMANFNPEHKVVLDDLLLALPLVQPGKMFGFPAYYVGGKLCICLYEEGVGIKLPEGLAQKLLAEDAHAIPFRPMGKPKMREWVQINLAKSEDYQQYLGVFEESIQYVLTVSGQAKTPKPPLY